MSDKESDVSDDENVYAALESEVGEIHTKIVVPGSQEPHDILLHIFTPDKQTNGKRFCTVEEEKHRILNACKLEQSANLYVMRIYNPYDGSITSMNDKHSLHSYVSEIATDSVVKIELIENIATLVKAH